MGGVKQQIVEGCIWQHHADVVVARCYQVRKHAAFAFADDEGLPLLDFKDLHALIMYVSENAKELSQRLIRDLLHLSCIGF